MAGIGFIGLGVMGRHMAAHIARHRPPRTDMLVHNLVRHGAADALAAGARWADHPADVARGSDIVIVMVADAPQIDSLLDGNTGLLAGVGGPLTLVICSTVAPEYVRALQARVGRATHGLVQVVDAPVSGGESGARAGSLSIMVGGEPEAVAPVLDLLASAGRPVHLGPLGSGQVAKACNQLICAATLTAIAEATVVAERSGLDVAQLLDLLQGGYAGSTILKDKATRYAQKDYTVSGAVKFWIKDLAAYLDEAARTGTPTVQADRLLEAVVELTEQGMGDLDTAVIQRWIAGRTPSGAPEQELLPPG